jgi:4-diphosphocytidyl-2-C-methyl-D-erythritol kinase
LSILRRPAPAKLNLTLEVLGVRADGFHEIRSVVTTLSLADEVSAEPGCAFVVSADDGFDDTGMPSGVTEQNSVETALTLIRSELARQRGEAPLTEDAALRRGLAEVALRLHKRIPAAAGLGGGSSDATAGLLLLNDFWNVGLNAGGLRRLAERVGSDCPLFLNGGVQSMGGRGELLEPLPAPARAWFCIVKPPVVVSRKTALLYSLLDQTHYSDGRQTEDLAQRLRWEPGAALRPGDLCNDFDRVAASAFGSLDPVRLALREAGAGAVHLCGAGPSLYGLFADKREAEWARLALQDQGYTAWAVFGPAA